MSPTTSKYPANIWSEVRSMTSKGRVQITVNLDGQDDSYVKSYTSLDKLEGNVAITSPHKIDFNDVQITFEGHAKSWVERVAATVASPTRVEAHHSFLRLTQPISNNQYPEPRVLEAGKTYTFPFTFVVPPRMVAACKHICRNDQIRDAHSELPPSFGDPTLAGDGEALLDDMAPDMSKIWYGVNASVTRCRQGESRPAKLAETMKKVRVIPAFDEKAPVHAEFKCKDYYPRAEKTITKGMLKGKLGRLVMEASQPPDLRHPPPSRTPGESHEALVSTRTNVQLRFDPADSSCQPPKLGQLVTKMKVNTWHSNVGMQDFPVKDDSVNIAHRGLYSLHVPLNSRNVQNVCWKKHGPGEERSGSVASIDSVGPTPTGGAPPPSSKYKGSTYYTAEIKLPLHLPKCKSFTPTFFNCLIARIYQLEIELSINTPGLGVSPSLNVRVPIEISSSLRFGTDQAAADFEPVSMEGDADPLTPRRFSPPPDFFGDMSSTPASPTTPGSPFASASPRRSVAAQGQGGSANASDDQPPPFSAQPPRHASTAPPGYSFFAGASHGIPVRIPSPMGISPGCG